MKAALFTDVNQIKLHEVNPSQPEPEYVMLDTKVTGICGTDLHFYSGHWSSSETYALGHETCGIVVEVGDNVTEFEPGDLVAVEFFSHCGRCVYCQTGNYNHCQKWRWVSHNAHGGFAEYTTVHSSGLFKLPQKMSHEEGALVEPLAVAHRAFYQAGVGTGDRLAIIGGGTIGQLCLAMAKVAGVKETLITVKYNQQAKLAKDLGADHVIDVNSGDFRAYIDEVTDGLGVDAVIETVGGGSNFNEALAVLRKRGVVVLVGAYFGPVSVDLWPVVFSEATIVGSFCYGYTGIKKDFQASIELIASSKIPVTKVITHRFLLDDIAQAFEVAADKRSGAIKVQIHQ